LHVDTEQRQYFAPIAMGFRHIEQTAKSAMAVRTLPHPSPSPSPCPERSGVFGQGHGYGLGLGSP
jgi:hypothetical protein